MNPNPNRRFAPRHRNPVTIPEIKEEIEAIEEALNVRPTLGALLSRPNTWIGDQFFQGNVFYFGIETFDENVITVGFANQNYVRLDSQNLGLNNGDYAPPVAVEFASVFQYWMSNVAKHSDIVLYYLGPVVAPLTINLHEPLDNSQEFEVKLVLRLPAPVVDPIAYVTFGADPVTGLDAHGNLPTRYPVVYTAAGSGTDLLVHLVITQDENGNVLAFAK
jgi:hypothetical protein